MYKIAISFLLYFPGPKYFEYIQDRSEPVDSIYATTDMTPVFSFAVNNDRRWMTIQYKKGHFFEYKVRAIDGEDVTFIQ